jgi:hypothetical protein
VLAKLSCVFVEVVRRYVDTLREEKELARCLQIASWPRSAASAQDPARAWTVDILAREVGLSRSALAQRFNDFLITPDAVPGAVAPARAAQQLRGRRGGHGRGFRPGYESKPSSPFKRNSVAAGADGDARKGKQWPASIDV